MLEVHTRWILQEQFRLPEQQVQRPCGGKDRVWHFRGTEGWPVAMLKGKT